MQLRILLAIATIVLGFGCSSTPDGSLIEEFRASERATIGAFNTLLRRQRANEIDEIDLAAAIDRDVLPAWRALRSRMTAAPVPDRDRALHMVLRRYLANRQTAWEAYSAALRSPSDEAAKLHYATYHALDETAVEDARTLGTAFRNR